MAFPTVAQCNTAAQARAADVSADISTAALLLPGIQSAVRKLFRKFQAFSNPRVIKTVFYPLPAYTTVLFPATAGISDMGEPIAIYERGNLTTLSVSDATPGASSLAVTTATHGRSTGDLVTLNQLGGLIGAEGMYAVTATSTIVLTFNGLVVTGTFTSGGTATYSADNFGPSIRIYDHPLELPTGISTRIEGAVWQGDHWLLTQSSEAREIAIDYYSSATVPTGDNDVIGVDDCVDFIAAEALAVVHSTRSPQMAAQQRAEANEILADMVRAAIKTMQIKDQSLTGRPPFRNRSEYTSSFSDCFTR